MQKYASLCFFPIKKVITISLNVLICCFTKLICVCTHFCSRNSCRCCSGVAAAAQKCTNVCARVCACICVYRCGLIQCCSWKKTQQTKTQVHSSIFILPLSAAAPPGCSRYSCSSRPCHRGELNLRLEGESGQVAVRKKRKKKETVRRAVITARLTSVRSRNKK